jgi:hypothetical protein
LGLLPNACAIYRISPYVRWQIMISNNVHKFQFIRRSLRRSYDLKEIVRDKYEWCTIIIIDLILLFIFNEHFIWIILFLNLFIEWSRVNLVTSHWTSMFIYIWSLSFHLSVFSHWILMFIIYPYLITPISFFIQK